MPDFIGRVVRMAQFAEEILNGSGECIETSWREVPSG